MLLFFFEQQHQASCVFLWLSNGTMHLRGRNWRLEVQKCVGYQPCSQPEHVLLVASGPSSFPVFCPVLSTCTFYIKTELLSIYCLPVKDGAKDYFLVQLFIYLFPLFDVSSWHADQITPPLCFIFQWPGVNTCSAVFVCNIFATLEAYFAWLSAVQVLHTMCSCLQEV